MYIVPVVLDIVQDTKYNISDTVPDRGGRKGEVGGRMVSRTVPDQFAVEIMDGTTPPPGETTWITLKEAAGMLGCSVKTIRRRIKGGTWRSMIEYQGQKAIRLVAREDVLKESSSLRRLPADTPEGNLAIRALDGLPEQLGEVLKNYLVGLERELDRRAHHSRIYLLVSLGLTAILLTGLGLHFSSRRAELLEDRIAGVSRTLSTTLTGMEAGIGRELSSISRQAGENRRLVEAARDESGKRGETLDRLLAAVDNLEHRLREERQESVESRREISALRREIARLEEALGERLPDPEDTTVNDLPDAVDPGDGELPDPEDAESYAPPPRADRTPQPSPERKSRFLGIF